MIKKSVSLLVFLSILLLLPTALQAQFYIPQQEEFEQYMLSIKDLDNDQICDTVYVDYENSVVICKLSSRDFEPIKSREIDHYTIINDTERGFSIHFGSFLGHWTSKFEYEPETNKIRLVETARDVSVENHLFGQSSINLLTNEYVGNWTCFDENENEIKLPTIKTTMPFPKTYLEDFGEKTCYYYSERCGEVVEGCKKKAQNTFTISNNKL